MLNDSKDIKIMDIEQKTISGLLKENSINEDINTPSTEACSNTVCFLPYIVRNNKEAMLIYILKNVDNVNSSFI